MSDDGWQTRKWAPAPIGTLLNARGIIGRPNVGWTNREATVERRRARSDRSVGGRAGGRRLRCEADRPAIHR